MKILNKYKENKFFIKMSVTYCLILIFGISVTAYFIIYDTVNDLNKTQLKYQNEVLTKISNNTDETLKEINKIISGLYINYNNITNLISPYKINKISDKEKEKLILQTMQNIYNGNNIVDMIILDKAQQKKYYYSGKFRDISFNYNFFKEQQSIYKSATNDIKIKPNHIPKYIIKSSVTSEMPVITIYVNLYDLDYVKEGKEIGVIGININPKIFFKPFNKEISELKGDIFILQENDLILSSNNKTLEDYTNLLNKQNNKYTNIIQSETTGLTYVNFVNKDSIFESIRNSMDKVIDVIIVSILLGMIVSVISSRMFTERIKILVRHIKKIEKGGFNTQIKIYDDDEIGYLERSFGDMCKKLSDYVDKVYISDIKRKTAEIQVLQAQINPHYMFNTLESIRMVALINKDQETANMISILGNMFRWNMRMRELVVTIQDELDYLKSYIELQKIRYENGFYVTWNIDNVINNYAVPKLILQPILENSFYHGGINGNKILNININGRVNESIYFEIVDDGNGMKEELLENTKSGILSNDVNENLYCIGLKNIHQRLTLLFGIEYGLQIDSVFGEGTTIVIKIPKLTKEEMNDLVQSNDSRR